MNDRRSYLILLGLILAALVGVALLAIPGSPIQRKPRLGLDLQGGLEVVLKAVPPKGRAAHLERCRPLDRDHAEPDRQARRERAGDPQAGLEPDRDRARRREEPAGGRGDHRQDGAAPVLRPRERPRPAVDRRPGLPGRDDEPLRAPVARPVDGGQEPRGLVRLQPPPQAGRRPGRHEGAGAQALRRHAAEGLLALRRADQDDGDHVRPAGGRLPGRQHHAHDDLLLPLQVQPAVRSGDDGQRPEALGHPGRLRPDHRLSRSC